MLATPILNPNWPKNIAIGMYVFAAILLAFVIIHYLYKRIRDYPLDTSPSWCIKIAIRFGMSCALVMISIYLFHLLVSSSYHFLDAHQLEKIQVILSSIAFTALFSKVGGKYLKNES